jgi:hypothetical protein
MVDIRQFRKMSFDVIRLRTINQPFIGVYIDA